MKCRDCGGDLYHYPGCNIGDHGDLVGDTEGAPMPDAPGDESEYAKELDDFAAKVRASTIITADDMNVRINARDDDPPATDTPAETRDDALFARILDLRHWTGAGDGSGKRHDCKCEDCKAIKQVVHLARQAAATSQSKRAKQLTAALDELRELRKDQRRLDWLDEYYAEISWLVPNSDPPVCEVCETNEGVRFENPKYYGASYSLRTAIDEVLMLIDTQRAALSVPVQGEP